LLVRIVITLFVFLNEFFKVLEEGGDWELKARTDGRVMKKIPAKDVWDQIAYAAWSCADPGTQYDTTINEWHTCPQGGRINASESLFRVYVLRQYCL
jgi:ribonucleoside-diphosphate reductase alpha chain